MHGVVAHAHRGAGELRMGGDLWSLVPQEVAAGPTTIRPADWPQVTGVAVGAMAVQRAGVLAVGDVVIDLRTAPAWSPEPWPCRPAAGVFGRARRLAD